MTGLETAIILIAFVVVASVFSYAVLSAGVFASHRSEESLYQALQKTKSNFELSGSVIAKSDDNATVTEILFTVKNSPAGNPMDLTECDGTEEAHNTCVISLTTKSNYFNNVKWSKTAIGSDNGNNLLESGEQFEITLNTADLGEDHILAENLSFNDAFNIQLKPSLGSTITVQRTLPASIDRIMDLH